jgi:hypothetical protein
MRAVMTIEEDDNGVKMGVIYEGTVQNPGFCAASDAHQHMCLVLKVLDQIAIKREATSDVRPVDDTEIKAAFNRVRELDESAKLGIDIVGDQRPTTIFVPTLSH